MDLTIPGTIKLDKVGSLDFGYVSFAESSKQIPFDVKRVYWTYLTPAGTKRGMHAHKDLQQLIFAVSGRLDVSVIDSQGSKMDFVLNDPSVGLYIPKMWWRDIWFSENTVLLSLASHEYDAADYIRNFDEFLKFASKNQGPSH